MLVLESPDAVCVGAWNLWRLHSLCHLQGEHLSSCLFPVADLSLNRFSQLSGLGGIFHSRPVHGFRILCLMLRPGTAFYLFAVVPDGEREQSAAALREHPDGISRRENHEAVIPRVVAAAPVADQPGNGLSGESFPSPVVFPPLVARPSRVYVRKNARVISARGV